MIIQRRARRARNLVVAFLATATLPLAGGAQDHDGHAVPPAAASDSAFQALQGRGREAMGVDQYTSTHVFKPLPDGGVIALERDVDDSVGAAAIRAHMRQIAAAFAAGDFSTPAFVHWRPDVPGVREMTARRAAIRYEVRDLPRGSSVRITASDPAAVRAVHEFLAFQNSDHRTGAH